MVVVNNQNEICHKRTFEIDRMGKSDVIDNRSHATDAPQEAPVVVVVVDADSSVESPHVRGVLLIHLIHVLLINLRRNRLRGHAAI